MTYKMLSLAALALTGAACASGGYVSAGVVYSEPAEYEYVVPEERVVVVSREVLVAHGYEVYRVEDDGPNRIIWARRGPGEVVRVFVTPVGNRVAVRSLREVREDEGEGEGDEHGHGHGRHKGWVRRGPPTEVVTDLDVRLRAH
ncbi:MAG TPA: hypothetical protein VFK78_09375 [Gemmatimonadales bacterium]|nr:hypothetical protein [Gemmatimonadales bacterium]